MTREHKLALIVGFSLFLVLGVLVSDHLSKSRKTEGSADLNVAEAKSVGAAPPGIVLASSTPSPALQPLPGQAGFGAQQPPAPLPEMNPTVARVQPVEFEMRRDPTSIPKSEVSNELAGVTTMVPSTGIETIPGTNKPAIPGTTGVISPTLPSPAPQTTVVVAPPVVETKPSLPVTTGQMKRHDIREGDSVYSLAKQTYGDGRLWEKLKDFNKGKIAANGSVREGVTIMLPPKDVLLGKAVMPDAKAASSPTPIQTAPGSPTKSDTKPARPDQRIAGSTGSGYTTYTVQKGDILEEVARKTLGSSKRWPEIVEANKAQISDPESIQVGMTLRIPSR